MIHSKTLGLKTILEKEKEREKMFIYIKDTTNAS